MRQLQRGVYRTTIRVAGRNAELTIRAGEVVDEGLYASVPQADRKLFRRVAAPSTPADEADQPTQPTP